MKKAISLMMGLILLFTFCGCSGAPDNSSSEEVEIIYQYENEAGEVKENQSDVSSESNTQNQPATSSTSSNSTSSVNDSSDFTSSAVQIDYETAVEVDLCDDVIRAYLDASTSTSQYSILNSYSGELHDTQNVKLSWTVNGSYEYTVYISENKDFSNSLIFKTEKPSLNPGVLVPGRTYYWRVLGQKSDEAIAGGKIVTKGAPVRFLDIDSVGNFRDLGGWTTESGKTVKYEKLYRGRQLESITSQGLENLKKLGIKTEIDIRMQKNNPTQVSGTGFIYKYFETLDSKFMYNRILKSENKEEVTTNYKAIFALLADESNYPLYFHCSGGADRTGTLAFLINGYLGVSYEDLTRDFELTSFSRSGARWRGAGTGGTFAEDDLQMAGDKSYVAWGQLYKGMMSGYATGDGKLSSAIENYLVNYVGVPTEHLESMKSIMLG